VAAPVASASEVGDAGAPSLGACEAPCAEARACLARMATVTDAPTPKKNLAAFDERIRAWRASPTTERTADCIDFSREVLEACHRAEWWLHGPPNCNEC
jgi:hypothetical protein